MVGTNFDPEWRTDENLHSMHLGDLMAGGVGRNELSCRPPGRRKAEVVSGVVSEMLMLYSQMIERESGMWGWAVLSFVNPLYSRCEALRKDVRWSAKGTETVDVCILSGGIG